MNWQSRNWWAVVIALCGPGLAVAADELPRVPPGFTAAVFAREPLVRNPCAMAFDSKGRLFVSQGAQYRNPTPATPGDRITMLLDTNGDGVADKTQDFAAGFNHIQGLAWRGGELWVANAPELTVVRDLDGDGEADEYRLIYGGLGNLEHALHGLNFAPDGRLYMSKGNSKGYLSAKSTELYVAPKAFADLWGMPFPENAPRIPQPIVFKKGEYKKGYHHPEDDWGTEGGILRCDRDGSNLEIFSRGLRNPWDMAFDENFECLATDQDQDGGDRIVSPFLGAHFGWGHVWSPDWTGEKHLPTVPMSGPLFDGSGTGIVYSTSDAMPAEYRGVFFVADWLNRSIVTYRPAWDGALLRNMQPPAVFAAASRGRTLGSSTGIVFDPTDIEMGPEGALWVLSWGHGYGATVKDGQQQDEGRVYRIFSGVPGNLKIDAKYERPYDRWTAAELIADLQHAALPVWRIDAQDELVRRGSPVRADLEQALVTEVSHPGAITWLSWTLGRLDLADASIDAELARRAASDTFAARIQALRVLAFRSQLHHRPLPAIVVSALTDKEPRLRFAAVQALQTAGQVQSSGSLWELAAREADRGVFYAAWHALAELTEEATWRAKLGDSQPGIRRAALLVLLERRAISGDEAAKLRLDEDRSVAELASSFVEKVGTRAAPVLKIEPSATTFVGSVEVRISAAVNSGLQIRYTLDGTEPSDSSGRPYDRPIVLKNSAVVQAALFRGRGRVGPVLTRSYALERAGTASGAQTRGPEGDGALPLPVADIQVRSEHRYQAIVLRVGQAVYSNRSYVWKELPPELRGCTVIQAANADADVGFRGDRFLEFKLGEEALVYVAHDRRIREKPAWLKSFAAASLVLRSDDTVFDVYEKRFPAGLVTLGGNTADGSAAGRSQYMVIVGAAPLEPRAEPTTLADALARVPTADALRGERLFFGAALCYKCHRVGERGNALAPNLTKLDRRANATFVAESILTPDAVITEGFQTIQVRTVTGKSYSGFLRQESGLALELVQANGEQVAIPKAEIEERGRVNKSAMPADFGKLLSPQQVADLSAYILAQTPQDSKTLPP